MLGKNSKKRLLWSFSTTILDFYLIEIGFYLIEIGFYLIEIGILPD